MSRYYTRVCNFYYGAKSKLLVKKKKTLPLHNNPEISFDKIEIITRNSKKLISLNEVNKLHVNLKTKVKRDLRLITKKRLVFFLDQKHPDYQIMKLVMLIILYKFQVIRILDL